MTKRRGWVERFHDDQLIVALPDLPAVKQALSGFGLRWGKIDENEALGLALVPDLDDVHEAVSALRQDRAIAPELAAFQAERKRVLPQARAADLDLLIQGVRAQFAAWFPGWEVTIGKNYGPSLVKGYPHVNGGGNGEPRPTSKPFSQPVCGHDQDPQRGHGVRVGLLDTRIFPDESLAGRYIAGGPGDVINPAKGPFTMFDGHCAFVGSCILQQAPAAELQVRHVLDKDGEGWAWEAATAMAELAGQGLDVVNLSFGEFLTDDNSAPMVLAAAVKRFSPETVVVAAAGNNGNVHDLPDELVHEGVKPNSASYPAALADVVGVGALDRDGKRAAFTPDPAPWIALLATGVGLVGAYVQGKVIIEHKNKHGRVTKKKPVNFRGRASWEGCSFAAGVVSGEIAGRTVPGRRSARQALAELLQPDPGSPCSGIVPNWLDNMPAE